MWVRIPTSMNQPWNYGFCCCCWHNRGIFQITWPLSRRKNLLHLHLDLENGWFFMGDSVSEWESRNRKWMVQHLMVVFFVVCVCLLDDQPNLNKNNKTRPKFYENWSMSWSLYWLLLVIKRSNGHVICCEFSWWATSCQVSRFCPISSLFCPISSFAPGSFKTCSGWMKTTPQI